MSFRLEHATGIALATSVFLLSGLVSLGSSSKGVGESGLLPAVHFDGRECIPRSGVVGYGPIGSTMPLHPVGVSVVWIPGSRDRDCRAFLVRGSSLLASKLVDDLDHAPRVLPSMETTSCPNDDASAARLFFEYRGRKEPVFLSVPLARCGYIAALGLRVPSSRLRADLASVAPNAAWRAWVLGKGPEPGEVGRQTVV